MCGIGGIISVGDHGELPVQLEEMMRAVAHRGPDGHGAALFDAKRFVVTTSASASYPDGRWFCGMGHRRLSIIDLSDAGHQPMSDPGERFWITYNGEVYNYLELREELEREGRHFRSDSDTEVVLQAFLEWGPKCLQRFNGMWAFAIYDRKTKTLFCARDRFGVKPFYYSSVAGRFAFASEIKQLLALPWVAPSRNDARLADFFLWKLETHTDQTFFREVSSLPGGHYLEVTENDLANGRFEPRRYWSPEPGEPLAEEVAVEAFRELLFDSVRLRRRSDVPVGVTLSGGIDSSTVVCVAGEQRRHSAETSPLKAFNVEFGDAGFSERAFAEQAAARADAQLMVLHPSENDLAKDWQKFVWHMEEPFGGLSYFSNYQIYRLIREQQIPVVLSGQGADELLLGYPRYRGYDWRFRLRDAGLIAALRETWAARSRANMPLRTQLASIVYFTFPRLRAARRRRMMRPFLRKEFFEAHAGDLRHLRQSMVLESPKALQISEMLHYQLPHLLHHEDRVSMAHSIEARLPFLDYRLLELVLGQPMDLLYRQGWNKYLLRQAMSGVIPDDIRDRRDKMGYETPTERLIQRNSDMFIALLSRNHHDSVLDVPKLEREFTSDRLDGFTLSSALSYLAWKETFSVI